MTHKEAQAILRALAEGLDPRTGEQLSEAGPWSEPRVIRALFLAVEALHEARVMATTVPGRIPHAVPANAGGAWTLAEEGKLRAAFESEKDIAALARLHGRTRGAIRTRLVRLGLMDPSRSPKDGKSTV
jgi:hypothetical protein